VGLGKSDVNIWWIWGERGISVRTFEAAVWNLANRLMQNLTPPMSATNNYRANNPLYTNQTQTVPFTTLFLVSSSTVMRVRLFLLGGAVNMRNTLSLETFRFCINCSIFC
jgi:hypothetical protein